ncbi:MerR family transcriptional regulator [Clavibacter tessellarius]|uniref:HTH merR-type domain-containing protein n=1 Tax=Clavibacter tessellarius TaxID=31965 RepID=A0A225CAZ0_9MICO|nr:MerR family transcriptional regulator [Clavibacter michiganensis]OQJ63689.1 hypothetical protein B5P24_12150 [Clavibacter michiganensis subsp. tessellarius]UKF33332.1 MerR family transcriptional regulator [Clavibacter michiganensis subsp. tessellarius]
MPDMTISELSARSDCPVATIKYYLREGLLHAGTKVNARKTTFDDSHLARIRLVRGLIHVVGVSVEQAGTILRLMSDPEQSVAGAMRAATEALPSVGRAASPDHGTAGSRDPSPTRELLDRLGVRHREDSVPVEQLERALELAGSAGIALDEHQITEYLAAVRRIARADFSRVPWDDPRAAVEFAVLGTALYEPVLLALRRVAHHEMGLDLEARDD